MLTVVHGAVVFVVKLVGASFNFLQRTASRLAMSNVSPCLAELLLRLHQHHCRRYSLVCHLTSPSSCIHHKLMSNFSPSCSARQETNTPMHHSACQELLLVHVLRIRVLSFLLQQPCVPPGCFALTFAVPTVFVLQPMNFFLTFSTPREVEHLVRVHPAQSPATVTVRVFVLSVDQRKLNTHRSRPLGYRAVLLTFCKLPTVSSHHFFRCEYCSVPYLARRLAQPSQQAMVSMAVRVQELFPSSCCCRHCLLASRGVTTDFACPMHATCPAQSERNARQVQDAIQPCQLKWFA